MRQVFSFGKFYGATREKVEASAFTFADVEDFVNSEVPLHTHENAHFLFVMSGEYEACVKDKKLKCPASTMLFYPAGTTHQDHFSSAGGRFLTISLTPDINQKLHEEIDLFDCSASFNDFEISCLGKRICCELQTRDSFSSIVLEGLANELLVYAVRRMDQAEKPPGWLKKAREVIDDGADEFMTVTEIAGQIGVHPLHLARTFRRFFNCSPGEYLRKCRIEKASNLLLDSQKSLAEIALESGFADQSQFTRSFRQFTGTTPARFRQIHNS